jgi:two-component system, OmpR family, phosphate regulon sensor histidine kinase PhoR
MAIQRNKSFQNRIFISFFAAFCLFAVAVLIYQYDREKKYRVSRLEDSLDDITVVTHNFIEQNHLMDSRDFHSIDSLIKILPGKDHRITLVAKDGKVLYDNFVGNVSTLENHLNRPEIQKAKYAEEGHQIRKSATTGQDFFYYARFFDSYFVRTAVIYDIQVRDFLKTERIYIVFILALFILMWFTINFVTRKIGSFVTQLKDFSVKAAIGEEIENEASFSDSELETISQQIKKIYNRLNKAKTELSREKEKLFQHLNVLQEGIAFFHPNRERFLTNSHFVHYINIISEKSTVTASDVLELDDFKPLVDFVVQKQEETFNSLSELPNYSLTIYKKEFIFEVKAIVFEDKSFEILITDISRLEKRKLIKQQLTANIAHELKTPVASLKGYLETIMTSKDILPEKRDYFIERAFLQSERLTSLLNDISLLNNIEEGGNYYEFREIKIVDIIHDVVDNQQFRLNDKNIKCEVEVDNDIKVIGNDLLLSSVFLNLVENSIRYAGENTTITISNYHSDQKYHYFSYSDNGVGIAEEHLSRIFERFYRTDEGRSRQTGGTGLGLSIAKNAIQLHKGEISVKNRPEGGLEFLFSLAKA